MDMKKILNIVSENKLESCGSMGLGDNIPQMSTPPVTPMTMSVNMNANGADQIKELLKLLSTQAETPMPSIVMPTSAPVDDPVTKISGLLPEPAKKTFPEKEEFVNQPDEKYSDHKLMTKDLAGGLNREKRQFKKAQDGDNAMAVESLKQQLSAMYTEIRSR
jgi:hypothetical protein